MFRQTWLARVKDFVLDWKLFGSPNFRALFHPDNSVEDFEICTEERDDGTYVCWETPQN